MVAEHIDIRHRKNGERVMGDYSTLPEEILQHVISFLPSKEAARTSVLSKAWLGAWQTNPRLRFHDDDFPHNRCTGKYSQRVCRKRFVNFVNSTLERYLAQKIGIESLKICGHSCDCEGCNYRALLDNWVQIGIECGVKKFDLDSGSRNFPQSVFQAKSLEELSVSGFRFVWPTVPKRIWCFNLKRLHVSDAFLGEVELQNIISSCPLIEYLNLDDIHGIEDLKVLRCLHLKELRVCSLVCQSVEIEAPNLELLSCNRRWETMLNNCSLNLKTSQNLKCLELFHVGINDMFFNHFNTKFPKLVELEIHSCNYLRCLRISSQSLRSICLTSYYVKEMWVDCPNIVQFGYCGRIVPLSFANSSRSWVSKIKLRTEDIVDSSWYCKLKEFLTNLFPSKIFLGIDFILAKGFCFGEMTDGLVFPQDSVHQLSFNSIWRSKWSSLDLLTILDGTFWVCRPSLLRLNFYHGHNNEFIQFVYRKLMVARNPDYCSSPEIKFWERDLKEVKVEFSTKQGNELDASVKESLQNMALSNVKSIDALIYFSLEWRKPSFAW